MLIACWSSKGGSGTTAVAAALVVAVASASPREAVLADLCGDGPAVLGLPEPQGPGLSDWLAAGDEVPDDGMARLEIDAPGGVKLLPRGTLPFDAGRAPALVECLAADRRPVVADCGTLVHETARVIAEKASVSLLVLRPCFLAVRRALVAPVRPSGVVLLEEEGRALSGRDVEELLGVPIRARIECSREIARIIDCGMLTAGLPRRVARALRGVA